MVSTFGPWREHLDASSNVRICSKCCVQVLTIQSNQPARRWWFLLRVQVNNRGYACGLKPLWWMISDHDGTNHATADGQYTIPLAGPIETVDPAEARRQLQDRIRWFSQGVIGDAEERGADDEAKMSRLETAERMVEWWGKEYDAALAEERENKS